VSECARERERERDASSQNSTSIASYIAASRSLKLAFYRCTPFIVQPHQATQNGVFRYFFNELKGGRERERERERVCVCVIGRER